MYHKLITEAERQIHEYANLEDGWDGYNAKSFSTSVLSECFSLLLFLDEFFSKHGYPHDIIPGPCCGGSVDIELNFYKNVLVISVVANDEGDFECFNVCYVTGLAYTSINFIHHTHDELITTLKLFIKNKVRSMDMYCDYWRAQSIEDKVEKLVYKLNEVIDFINNTEML